MSWLAQRPVHHEVWSDLWHLWLAIILTGLTIAGWAGHYWHKKSRSWVEAGVLPPPVIDLGAYQTIGKKERS